MGVAGSGVAGTVVARVLRAQGHDVSLVERGRHPRFALGESSTPLAALSLERLARRYGLEDLADLAAYGRWTRRRVGIRRGLKRGFTFYGHRRGRPYENDDANRHRLLVAANPSREAADAHWYRADVDAHLVERARREGVEVLEETEILGVAPGPHPELRLRRRGRPQSLRFDLLVDATGAGSALPRSLGLTSRADETGLDTGVVWGHLRDVPWLSTVPSAAGAAFPRGPYADERAAVHHLADEGWIYLLRFDHGVTSAGFVLDGERVRSGGDRSPREVWRELLEPYPALREQLADARRDRTMGRIGRLQRWWSRAAGDGWVLTPGTFFFAGPMFSTGIAWSLRAAERIGLALEGRRNLSGGDGAAVQRSLDRYAGLLEAEARQVTRLVSLAWATRRRFPVFAAATHLYFAAASWAEARERVLDRPEGADHWAWTAFLGAEDDVLVSAARRARERHPTWLRVAARAIENGEADPGDGGALEEVGRLVARRNVAGLADPGRRRMYPLDVDALRGSASLLGMDPDELEDRLSRLRGWSALRGSGRR